MEKYIIFDMDGVLFDSEQLVLRSWKEVAGLNGIDGIEDIFQKCIGTNHEATRQIVLDHFGPRFPYDEFREEASQIFTNYVRQYGMPMKSGVDDLLSYLKEQHYKIGLASSTRREKVMEQLEMTGIIGYFEQIICGDMVKKSKPDPEIFLICCEKLGGTPENTIVIEDSYNGIRAAYTAGMIPVMVPDMLEADEEMHEKAETIQPCLSEVKEWIKKKRQ